MSIVREKSQGKTYFFKVRVLSGKFEISQGNFLFQPKFSLLKLWTPCFCSLPGLYSMLTMQELHVSSIYPQISTLLQTLPPFLHSFMNGPNRLRQTCEIVTLIEMICKFYGRHTCYLRWCFSLIVYCVKRCKFFELTY